MTLMEAQADPFTALLAQAQDLKKGDDAAVKALLAEMLAVPLSDERSDMLVRAAARASRFALATVRSLVAAERLSREREGTRATPEGARGGAGIPGELPRRQRRSFTTRRGKGSGRPARTWPGRPTS